ncbi:MAG: hypothetical protein C4326_13035 [Ignavibacteria bacterium]
MREKFYLHLAAMVLLALLSFTCKKEPPPAVQMPTLALEALDASCTEVWLKATTTQLPATVRLVSLTPTAQTKQTLRLITPDTILIDEGLLPSQTYSYQLQRLADNSAVVETTPTVQVRTMDTTSHEGWTWEIDTVGDGASVLYDVAIINDTLAYAVGQIYKRDSMGNWDPDAYNAAKWNGAGWELKRIPFIGSCSAVNYPPIRAIWAFSQSNILVTNGGSIVRYDGTNAVMDCGINSLLTGAINKIYAVNPHDVYAVGNAGTIAHYDGVRWRRLESGTGAAIHDVWGGVDSQSGESTVLCVASNLAQVSDRKIIRIKQNGTTDSVAWGIDRDVISIWFQATNRLCTAGGGVFVRRPNGQWVEQTVLPLITTERVRGQSISDIFVTGHFGYVAYYNGSSWVLYPELAVALFYSCDYRSNTLVAVGQRSGRAVVVRM